MLILCTPFFAKQGPLVSKVFNLNGGKVENIKHILKWQEQTSKILLTQEKQYIKLNTYSLKLISSVTCKMQK